MQRKFYPGMWLQNHGATNDASELENSFAKHPAWVGVLFDFPWSMVEPERGKFDWSIIDKYRAWAEANDKVLSPMLMDRDFQNKTPTNRYTPKWVKTVDFPRKTGSMAAVWEPEVVDAKIDLLKAFAERYDDDPLIAMLTLTETALVGQTEGKNGYTAAGYTDELYRMHEAIAPALQRTPLVHYIHYSIKLPIAETVRMFAEQFTRLGFGLGRPDMPPWQDREVWPIWEEYSDRILIAPGGDVSFLMYPGYNKSYYTTFDELIQKMYAHQRAMGAHLMMFNAWFANNLMKQNSIDSKRTTADWQSAVIRFIESEPQMNTKRPSSLDGGPVVEPAPELLTIPRAEVEKLHAQLGAWLS